MYPTPFRALHTRTHTYRYPQGQIDGQSSAVGPALHTRVLNASQFNLSYQCVWLIPSQSQRYLSVYISVYIYIYISRYPRITLRCINMFTHVEGSVCPRLAMCVNAGVECRREGFQYLALCTPSLTCPLEDILLRRALGLRDIRGGDLAHAYPIAYLPSHR